MRTEDEETEERMQEENHIKDVDQTAKTMVVGGSR